MTNETLQTIRSRRSCRAYEPRQICLLYTSDAADEL